ncbi:hypothetical protein LCG56_28955 (plasmid) [Pseudomonas cannabina pv. alisalensis]|uniref:Uncharacterized protein n=1 Tax=Pseudomonas syringae pv. maculicola str. ES4326 TaxID=629265 RepID=A0A8T8C9P5_PSEYM|nr:MULTISPECIES: hypothetical protein [Pseudomonas syringae group]QHF00423.1 hypothetical protein PMA4326_028300 [Pseudomonas syringae pv. maculicola str. ES4326]UBZ00399.1 hypothetical protein LCG56_28955 [Pseudomonas cannabina pv. alisalensis]
MPDISPDVAALNERLRISTLAPHRLTLAQFLELGDALPVEGNPRSWEVSHGRFLTWAEAESADAALKLIHRREVESSLKWNSTGSSQSGYLPTMPTGEVLNDYPDLKVTYAEILTGVLNQSEG